LFPFQDGGFSEISAQCPHRSRSEGCPGFDGDYPLYSDIDRESILAIIERVDTPELEDTAMTAAEQLIQRGRTEGSHETAREWALDNLSQRPEDVVERIQAIDDRPLLKGIARSAFTLNSIEEWRERISSAR